MDQATTVAKGKSAAERAAAARARDARKDVKQVNVRVPSQWDSTIQMLGRELRAGMRLEGFVVRDPKTGRVKTLIV